MNLPARAEWGVVETKLKIIEREDLAPKIDMLGAAPALAHLRRVHARYGEVTGATKAGDAQEPPKVRKGREALLASIHHYTTAVTGSVMRSKPETKSLADALLKPLVEWKTPAPKEQPAEADAAAEAEAAKPAEAGREG